jgi:hypothetical protein
MGHYFRVLLMVNANLVAIVEPGEFHVDLYSEISNKNCQHLEDVAEHELRNKNATTS